MKNFEFKSAISTSVEQSKRLLELGLKKETADMMLYQDDENNPNHHVEYCIEYQDIISNKDKYLAFKYIEKRCVPAWSLHRIVEIMFEGDINGFVGYNIHDNNVGIMYEYAISNIEALIKIGSFNQDYLEEKK